MKRFFLSFLLLFTIIFASAQVPKRYWVEFADKKGTSYSVERPLEFLSPRAVELRRLHNIAIDERDLPVNRNYMDRILLLDTNARIFAVSKWLNGVSVYAEREDMKAALESLPFVSFVEVENVLKNTEQISDTLYVFPSVEGAPKFTYQSDIAENGDFDYGLADAQVRVNNAHWLHRLGFRGEGMQMMVLDGGFENVDTLSCFRVLCGDNRLLGARNIVLPDKDPMRRHTHGTMVLSCIASYLPGKLVGTAPMVQAFICQTEDSRSESRAEEANWIAGVEMADSLGCQVLNSSLGYTAFDDTVNQRTYKDMNGKVSRASCAATIAASKGMIVCNSAGNEGGKSWNYIGAPADADSILTVGAVNVERKRAFFSSFGPTADGRTKPDACAVGRNTFISTPKGIVTLANGTSFSSPLLSGMVACLWQAFPEKSNFEIMDVIRRAGDRYPSSIPGIDNPLPFEQENGYGYGITDFLKAYNLLLNQNNEVIPLYNAPFYSTKDVIVFMVKGSVFKQNYSKILVTATPLKAGNATLKTGNAKKLKVKYSVVQRDNISKNLLLTHIVSLPKLAKSKNYQLYRIDVSIDGRMSSFVVGQE